MDSTGFAWLPTQGSTMAGEVDWLFNFILIGSAILFALVVGIVIYFLIRYRRHGKAGLTRGPEYNVPLEVTWTVLPTVIILFIFFWGFRSYLKMHVPPHDSMEINVTAQKWFWSFDYPEGASSVNDLVVPVNKPIKLLMSSQDVIHSFYVPDFRVKMDVLPNRYTIAWFQATHTGEYDLFCAEYCGTGHSSMLGKVKVMTDSGYTAWLNANSNLGEGMTPVEFGEQLYQQKACVTCHSTDGSIKTGPSFLGAFGHEVLLSNGDRVKVDENYVRESILDPKAKIVNGFQPVMPTFQGVLKEKEIDALIAFIKSLSKPQDSTI